MPSTSRLVSGLRLNPGSAAHFSFRPYRPADLDDLYRIDTVCFEAPFRFSRGDLKRLLEDVRAWTCVAESQPGGKVAGFLLMHFVRQNGASSGYVVTLDVLPASRRAGLGSSLMHHAERALQERGETTLHLHVHSGNGSARRFYAALGFVDQGGVDDFYGHSIDARLLEKRVDG